MDTSSIILLAIAVLIFSVALTYYLTKFRFEIKFKEWRESERLAWKEARALARKEAISQSRAVLGGRFVEQLVPYLPEFKYDPTEARFIGSPVDLIVFPGLASGDPHEIVIIEVKTSKTAQLTYQERRIRQLIEDGMVRWELIQKLTPEDEGYLPED